MTDQTASRRPLLLVGALLLLLAIAGLVIWRQRSGGELTLYGNVDIREVTLGFRVGGRVEKLLVDEGDVVQKGEEIARLDTTPLELERNEAKANTNALAARMALLRAGFRHEDIAQAAALVAERRSAAMNADQLLARQERLKGTGAVAERTYDDVRAARDQAHARLQAAERALEESHAGFRHQEVAEGEANAARAAALAAEAEQRLDDAVLRAPADGVVLTRAVEAGAILASGTPVFTISLTKPVWARVYVGEPDLGKLPPGTQVLLHTDARPGQPYHGQVGYVSPTAEFTPKNVETPDLRTALVYRARVIVADPDAALRQGMPVTVTLAGR
jgi:HlyD family secretion protein